MMYRVESEERKLPFKTNYKFVVEYESHSDVLDHGVSGPGLKIDGPGPEYPNTLGLDR